MLAVLVAGAVSWSPPPLRSRTPVCSRVPVRLMNRVLMSAADDDVMVRLDKLLAERGAGSRKDVDRLIRKGVVEIDGEVVGKNGAKLKVRWGSSPVVDGFDYPPPPLMVS